MAADLSHLRDVFARSAMESSTGRRLDLGEEAAGAIGVDGRHVQRHLAGVAHAERVYGLHELAAHHGGNAVAVEEGLDDQGLRLIATAPHLDQTRGRWLRRACPRKRNDLAPACHCCDLYHS